MFNAYAKRTAVLGKKKAAMIASDEYIDKEGKIRCRVCQGVRRAPVRLNNEIIQMCCLCPCKKKEKQVAQTPGVRGFGMVNVNLRIRLYYNQPEGLHIESGVDGTRVSFCVPCRTREEIENDQSLSG